jgi:uncharacterized protein with von Willebrand factor type A (vWA) domain
MNAADEVLLGFCTALRAAGVVVTHDRAAGFLEAAARLDAGDRVATYRAGRATLCGGPDDVTRYDQVFCEYFAPEALDKPRPRRREAPPAATTTLDLEDGEPGEGDTGGSERVAARVSDVEVLWHRDVASLTAAERARMQALFGALLPRPPTRRTARHEPARRGRVDLSRTLRATLRRHGEPAPVQWRRRGAKPRRVVLLVDVSGSMSGYADALLRLAHAITHGCARGGGRVETFTVGTRLTHITRALRLRDPDRALVAAGETVPDWSGGTRLGETLQAFLASGGRRDLARGAVVVVLSDGWERGDAALLGEQVRRLRRVAHRVVWVNPHRGKAGYEPVQAGIAAALPHVDALLAGHSLATFAELVEVVADA